MLTLVHDYASPASAVAVWRLHALQDEGLPVVFVGYQPLPLEVAIPPTLATLEQLERFSDEAAALGLRMQRPRRLPPTTGAHLVAALANERGLDRPWRETAYRALWERGEDLGSVAVLVDLASDVGLERGHVRDTLDDRVAVARVKRELSEPRARNVGDVPALDVDGTLVSPFLSPEDLRQLAAL